MNENTINQTLLYKYVKKLYPLKARQIMQDNSNNLFGFHGLSYSIRNGRI